MLSTDVIHIHEQMLTRARALAQTSQSPLQLFSALGFQDLQDFPSPVERFLRATLINTVPQTTTKIIKINVTNDRPAMTRDPRHAVRPAAGWTRFVCARRQIAIITERAVDRTTCVKRGDDQPVPRYRSWSRRTHLTDTRDVVQTKIQRQHK